MGAPFAQWLGKPSTICFLRRVLATTEERLPTRAHGRNGCRCNFHMSAASHSPPNELSEEGATRETKQRKQVVRLRNVRDNDANETALRMSLNSGVSLLEEDSTPEQAFKALWRQTQVGSRQRLGTLVIDRPEHRENMRLWIELLEHRQRIDGFGGVLEVWKGMRFRKVDLPTSGPEADALWTTLLHAGISKSSEPHKEILNGVLGHAREIHRQRGVVWPGLYKCIVGRLLRIMPYMARVWHRKLVGDFGLTNIALADLAPDCAASLEPKKARASFKDIRRGIGQKDLYDKFIPQILDVADIRTALQWHRDFIKVGDAPGAEVFALPDVQRLFELDGDQSLPMLHATSNSHQSKPIGDNPQYPPLTRTNMSTLVGEVHGIKAREVSDTFVAKMFATRAFSLDLVIKGLGFFGVETLGPLALHEMAIRAKTVVDFRNKLLEIKAMGISINKSVYGRLILQIATNRLADLFQVLLSSDQHPEAYDDSKTQESLLEEFLLQQDILSAHITLLALSLTGQVEHARAWNRVLQYYIVKRDFSAMKGTMRQMQEAKMRPTMRTLNFINRNILPHRDPGKTPQQTEREALKLKPLQFTTNAYIFAAQNKIHVGPTLWKELLKRYGMDLRWDECERLAQWLASWYGRDVSSRTARGRRNHYYGVQMLSEIFGGTMQKALIHWGFRYAGHRKLLYKGASCSKSPATAMHEECEPWARGLLLLTKIRKSGIGVSLRDIRRALTIRLLPLFGPAYSVKRINEEARLYNELRLADYIGHANQICKTNLFSVDPALLSDNPQKSSELMIAIFGHHRRIDQRNIGEPLASQKE